VLSPERAGALAAALARIAPPPAPSASLAAPAPSAAPPPTFVPPTGWTKSAGRRLSHLFVAACEAGIDRLGRRPKDPDPDDEEEFGEALGAQLARWFPDAAMQPWMLAALSGGSIVGGMWIGAEKLPRDANGKVLRAPAVAPAAGSPTPQAIPAPAPAPPRPTETAQTSETARAIETITGSGSYG